MRSVAIPVFVETHACGSESNKANGKSHFQLSLGSKDQYSRAGFVVSGAHFSAFSAPFMKSRYTEKHCCNYRQKTSSGADLHLD